MDSYGIAIALDRAEISPEESEVMPTIRTGFEREIREISRAALQLEKLMVYSNSNRSPVHYQQILRRVSELYVMWTQHRDNQSRLVSTLLRKERQLPFIVQDVDNHGFDLEQQLKGVTMSSWPRSAHGGLSAIRVSVSGILESLFRQIERERATYGPVIHRPRNSPLKNPQMLPSVAGLRVKRISVR
jgi:hypothetical protein